MSYGSHGNVVITGKNCTTGTVIVWKDVSRASLPVCSGTGLILAKSCIGLVSTISQPRFCAKRASLPGHDADCESRVSPYSLNLSDEKLSQKQQRK